MKKFLALLLALVIVIGLAACGEPAGNESQAPASAPAGNSEAPESGEPVAEGPELSADGRYPAETVKIGFVNYDTTAQQFLSLQDYFDYLDDYFNFEIMYSESLDSAEAEFAFIEQCAAAGCQGIIGYYNEGREESVKLASSLGMYYWGQGQDPNVQEACGDDPYYLGSYYVGNADYEYGKSVIESLVAADCHKIIVVTGGKDFGVQMFIDRYQGMMDAIQEAQDGGYDIEVVYEVPGWPGTEDFTAEQTSALATDADGLASALSALMWIQPISAAGKMDSIKIAAVDTPTADMVDLMASGLFVGVAAEIPDVFGLGVPMIINAVQGYGEEQRNEDGTAPLIDCGFWLITTAEEMEYYSEIEQEGGTWCFDADDVRSILYDYNPELTLDDMSALYSAVTMEEIQARR